MPVVAQTVLDQHVSTANGETAAHNMVTGVYIHTGVEV
jgi:hypothetical protein